MSRLAQVLRKAAGAATSPSGDARPTTWDPVSGPYAGVEVPWDLGTPDDSRPAPLVLRAPAPPPVRSTASARTGDLVAMIQRIYQPGQTIFRRRAVVFTGIGAGASSGRVCATVAEALAAQTAAPVCLVDADLRAPASRDGEAEEPGLSDVLAGSHGLRASLRRISSGLCVLPRGSRAADGLSRLTPDRLRPCLQDLHAAFDYLVVCAPPAGVHDDAAVLAGLVDGAVLVISASRTRRETARQAVAQLKHAGVNVLGSILADRTYPIPDVLYAKL